MSTTITTPRRAITLDVDPYSGHVTVTHEDWVEHFADSVADGQARVLELVTADLTAATQAPWLEV